jgi:hypothetical protein
MDPELLTQLNDQIATINDLIAKQNNIMASQVAALNSVNISNKNKLNATSNTQKARLANDVAVSGNIKKSQAAQEATRLVEEASSQFSTSLRTGKDAILNFASSVVDSTPGMSKYAGGITGLSQAAGGILSIFGPLGKVAGSLVGIIGEVATSSLKFQDNIVDSYDKVARAGGGIGNSAEGILDLGHKANLSSGTLTYLTKAVEDMGPAIKNLGITTGQGVQVFGQMIAVGDKNLQYYRKMGYTQEELIDTMANYAKLQAEGGAMMTQSPRQLQKASLAYIDKLNILAEITGVSAKKQQDLLALAMQQENFRAHIAELERDKANATTGVERDQIQALIDAKREAATFAEALDPKMATAILETASTKGPPVLTASSAQLAQVAPNFLSIMTRLSKGENVTGDLLEMNRDLVRRSETETEGLVFSVGAASRNFQDYYMIGNNSRENAARFGRGNVADFRRMAADQKAKLEEAKRQEDTAIAERSQIESYERDIRKNWDTVMQSISPKVNELINQMIPLVTQAILFVKTHMPEIEIGLKGLGIILGIMSGVAIAGKVVNTFKSIKDAGLSLIGRGGEPGSSRRNKLHIRLAAGSSLFGKVSGATIPKFRKEDLLDKHGNILGGAALDSRLAKLGIGGDIAEDVTNDESGILQAFKNAAASAGQIALGAAALGAAIAEIGAGIAGATWMVGKTLPTFAEGLSAFNKVDGQNLKGVGIGMAGIGFGIIALGVGNVLEAITNLGTLFGGKSSLEKAADQLVNFQAMTTGVNPDKIKQSGEAAIAFAKAMGAMALLKGISGLSAAARAVSNFFEKNPPFDKLLLFEALDINVNKVRDNAMAFSDYASAMFSFKGNGSTLGQIATLISDSTVKFFGQRPPVDQFLYFSFLPINIKRTQENATAFRLFSEALASYKGTGNLVSQISSMVGTAINHLFSQDGPIEAFQKFSDPSKYNFGPNATKNALAFFDFAVAMSILSGQGSANLGKIVGNGISSAVVGLATAAGNAISSAASTIGSMAGAAISSVGNVLDISKARGPWKEDKEFLSEVNRVSQKYGFAPGNLLGMMASESGLNPAATNPKGGATGLIQFMPSTAAAMGTSTGALRGMPRAQQMKYVDSFLAPHRSHLQGASPGKLYGYIFLPARNNNFVLTQAPEKYYNSNKGLDVNPHDGKITTADLDHRVATMAKRYGIARTGGLYSGPTGGYPIELHGTEIIIPALKNSILSRLAQNADENTEEILADIISSSDKPVMPIIGNLGLTIEKIIENDNDMRYMVLAKIDQVLEIAKKNKYTKQKTLRAMRV